MKDEKNTPESEKFEMFLRAIVIGSTEYFFYIYIYNRKLMIKDD